jgi:hypothetical protein
MTIPPEQRKQFLEEVQAFKEQEEKEVKAQKELDEAKRPTVLVGKTIAFKNPLMASGPTRTVSEGAQPLDWHGPPPGWGSILPNEEAEEPK